MTFFSPTEPILRPKQQFLDVQDLEGLWRIRWKVGYYTLFSAFYTRIDQVFILWGLISAVIFTIAQFLPFSWTTQAVLWSAITLVGSASMVALTWFWVKVERLCWVVYLWTILMLAGLALTDFSIFTGWGEVLICLCPVWLGLNAFGYFCTGFGMQSRAFVIVGMIHLLGIIILPYVAAWQFLCTGIIIAGSLLGLAELQWDMRAPKDSDFLTLEHNQFNREQHIKRQLST